MESTEAPVFQLSEEISGANTLCQVELSLPVETQNVLEYLGGAVEIKLSCGEVVGIAQGRYFSWSVLFVISLSEARTAGLVSHLHKLHSEASVICSEETCRWSPT